MRNKEYIEITGLCFAYDTCHKFYICEDVSDIKEAIKGTYDIFDMKDLKKMFITSCPLRFIDNWKLTKVFVGQGEPKSHYSIIIK